MEVNQFIKIGKINAVNKFSINPYLVKNIVYIQKKYNKKSVEDYILKKTKSTKERMTSSFRLVNLSEDICLRDISLLSSSEKFKVELAISLIENREQIFLYQFDKYFMEKDLFFFKKLFKKLSKKYNKTIVFIDSKFSFMLDFVDYLVIKNIKNEVIIFDKDDFYKNNLEGLIEIPEIIDFVKYVNRNSNVIEKVTDIKELIKAIYREV